MAAVLEDAKTCCVWARLFRAICQHQVDFWIAPADRRFALPAKLPDPAPALSIPCRHCVGERDLGS
jgi:hypothetical protein